MAGKKLFSRISLAIAVLSLTAYIYLSYFLPFDLSMNQILNYIKIISVIFIISFIIFLSYVKLFRFQKFESEFTTLFTSLAVFYFLSFFYTENFFYSLSSLKSRRIVFIIVDSLYIVLAAYIIYLFVLYFFPKLLGSQQFFFYAIIYLFIIALEFSFFQLFLYIAVFFFFMKMPWLIAVSHNFRRIILTFCLVFLLLFILLPKYFLQTYELFPQSPRIAIGTKFQMQFNFIILIFFLTFTLKVILSLIETSRTLRSKNVLAYFLTSFFPVTIILILFFFSYVNIAIFFKYYILSDKFLEQLQRYNNQFFKQQSFVNFVKYSPDETTLENRVRLDRYSEVLDQELGSTTYFKLQYLKDGEYHTITSPDFPVDLKPNDLFPEWYEAADEINNLSGLKEVLTNIFVKKIENQDRMFVRTDISVYYVNVDTYRDENLQMKLGLFLKLNDALNRQLDNSYSISITESGDNAVSNTSLLSSSFVQRSWETGDSVGSVKFTYYDSFTELFFGLRSGEHILTQFLRGLRDLIFSVLFILLFIIALLGLVARNIYRGIRISLQTIILGMRIIGEGNLDYKIELQTRDEYYRLANSINDMTEDIKLYMEERVETERIRGELNTAYNIQMSILPGEDPVIPGMDVSSYIQAADEVGGDFFDFLKLDKNRLGLAIGDVSGHGVSAGILMAMAKSCMHNQTRHSKEVTAVMDSMNKMVFDTVQKRLLMTFLYAIIDPKKKTLTYSNAGHHFPYIYSVKNGKLDVLEYPSYPLGVRRETKFKKKTAKFNKGDFLLFYSDGIIEQTNRANELFGFDRVEEILKNSKPETAQELKNIILDHLNAFSTGMKRVDDVTLIVIKIC